VAAVFGAILASQIAPLLPFSLALAGGAMLYVVSDELIPESHSHGYEHEASAGFIVGFLLLLALLRFL
jgi:ZIP family zinc transporter